MTFQTRNCEALASLGASEISQSDQRSYYKLNLPFVVGGSSYRCRAFAVTARPRAIDSDDG
jgi:hypothetical protein